jgi:hypothetical protein
LKPLMMATVMVSSTCSSSVNCSATRA